MWTLLRLATRNVTRNKSRTALTLAAIGLGVLMAVFLGGIVQGFVNALTDDTVLGKSGAIQIHKKGYADMQDASPLDFDMPQGGEVEKTVLAIPGVANIAPRLVFQGLLNSPTSTSMLVINAVDPAVEYKVLPRSQTSITGKTISEAAPSGAVIGVELGEALNVVERAGGKPAVVPGATAVLSAARKSGQQNALDVDIGGLITTGTAFENKRLGYVPLKFAQELLGMDGRVNEFFVSVRNRDDVPQVTEAVAAALGSGYEVKAWQEARPDASDRIRYIRTVLVFVCVVFLVIVVFGVVNTMLMSVMERTREIGTMLAVGVKRGQITLLFLLEGLTLAVMGGLGGAAGGLAIVGAISAGGGFPITPPGASAPWQILPHAPTQLVILTVAVAMIGSLVASAYPAARASRLRPVEALRAV